MESVVTPAVLDAQAAEWLVRSEAVDCTPEERSRLEEWLAVDARHRAAYVRVRAAWGRAAQFRRLRPLDGHVDADLLSETILPSLNGADRAPAGPDSSPGQSRPLRKLAFAAAAAIALAIGLTAWLVTGRVDGERYSTDYGNFERITLRDGSTVSMNTDSLIRVRMTEDERVVQLERGEALFVVSRDTRRPFEVEAAGTRIRALGTAFSVRIAEGHRVDVLVTEGSVAIEPRVEEIAASAVSMLQAGEASSIGSSPAHVRKMSPQALSRQLGWLEGRLWFDQEALSAAVAEFNRYNRRKLIIADPTIAEVHIGGGFSATDPESFVSALQRTFGIRALPAGSGNDAVIRLFGAGDPERP